MFFKKHGFYVSDFDFGLQKDLNFLNGFNKLEHLSFDSIYNLTAFQYLPPLHLLQALEINACPDLNQIPFPDLSPAKLNYLNLNGNKISGQKAEEIFVKLAASTSVDSLKTLYLSYNFLTSIPSQLGSAFPNLKTVYLDNNNISHIPSSSLNFASPYLEYLYLKKNQIKTIENDAFQGKSTDVRASIFFRLKNYTL